MTNERGDNGCPHSSKSDTLNNYAGQRQANNESRDLTPIFNTAGQIAQIVFQEHFEPPLQKNERPMVLDDSGQLVILPGSLGYQANLEANVFFNSMFSSTHNLLHREENRERVAHLFQQILRTIPLFPYGIEQYDIAEIKRAFENQETNDPEQKHAFMLTETHRFIGGAYGVRLMRGITATEMSDLQPIADFVALRKILKEIELAKSNSTKSLEESSIEAYHAVNDDRSSGTIENVRGFTRAGVNEAMRISIATIDGMRSAVKEWNETNPDEAVDLYQFGKTEGKKFIAVMAGGHLHPTFDLLRGLCGESYLSELPTFPPRTLGLGKHDGAIKMGFRISEIDTDKLLALQTMHTAYTSGAPRTRCPALGSIAEDLYLNTLNTYRQCMS